MLVLDCYSITVFFTRYDCKQNIIFHALPLSKSFYVSWDKLQHPHNIAFITFLHTLRHYTMAHEYQPLATLFNMAKFSTGILNYLHIATMWHYIYLLLPTYLVEQINFAYFFSKNILDHPLLKLLSKIRQ